jgi:ribosomal protein S27E
VRKFKNDSFSQSRGRNSKWLDIVCASCNQTILLYQKDGQGALHRLYRDRITEPAELVARLEQFHSDKDALPLACPKCGAIFAHPMMYEKEHRLAFRLIPGRFHKHNNKGA